MWMLLYAENHNKEPGGLEQEGFDFISSRLINNTCNLGYCLGTVITG